MIRKYALVLQILPSYSWPMLRKKQAVQHWKLDWIEHKSFNAVLYGAFLVMFAASLFVLLVHKERIYINKMMAAASIAMLFLISTNVILNVMCALITKDTGVIGYYDIKTTNLERARIILYCILSLVGDAVVIYKCWVLYEKKLRILLVPCMIFGATAVVVAMIYKNLIELKPDECIFSKKLAIWALFFFSLTLVVNVLCSFLIAARILSNTTSMRNGRIARVVTVVIESAVIYTLGLLIAIGTYVAKSDAVYIAGESLPLLIGIVFNLMIAMPYILRNDIPQVIELWPLA